MTDVLANSGSFRIKSGSICHGGPSTEILIAAANTRSKPWYAQPAARPPAATPRNFLASCSNTIASESLAILFASSVCSATKSHSSCLSKHCDPTPRRRHHHCHASQIGGCNRCERRGGTWSTVGKVRLSSRRQCKDPSQMHPAPCRRPACCRARHVFASSFVLLSSAPSSPQHMGATLGNPRRHPQAARFPRESAIRRLPGRLRHPQLPHTLPRFQNGNATLATSTPSSNAHGASILTFRSKPIGRRVRLTIQVCVDGGDLAQPHPRRGTLVQVASIDLSRCTQSLQPLCVAAHIPLRTLTWPLEWVEGQSTFVVITRAESSNQLIEGAHLLMF